MMLKLKLQYFGYLMKSWLIGKDCDAGRNWGQEEKGTTEDRWLDGIIDSMDMSLGELWEFGDAQGGLAGCNSRGRKESDTTEQLNWTELKAFEPSSLGQSRNQA